MLAPWREPWPGPALGPDLIAAGRPSPEGLRLRNTFPLLVGTVLAAESEPPESKLLCRLLSPVSSVWIVTALASVLAGASDGLLVADGEISA